MSTRVQGNNSYHQSNSYHVSVFSKWISYNRCHLARNLKNICWNFNGQTLCRCCFQPLGRWKYGRASSTEGRSRWGLVHSGLVLLGALLEPCHTSGPERHQRMVTKKHQFEFELAKSNKNLENLGRSERIRIFQQWWVQLVITRFVTCLVFFSTEVVSCLSFDVQHHQ